MPHQTKWNFKYKILALAAIRQVQTLGGYKNIQAVVLSDKDGKLLIDTDKKLPEMFISA